VFTRYGPQARAVLEALLTKYQDEPVTLLAGLDDPNLLRVSPFTEMGTVPQLIRLFGDAATYQAAVRDLQRALYAP